MSAIAAIHVGCKQLGIAEEDRRDLYERVTNKRSLKGMTPKELEAIVSELRAKGFKKSSGKSRSKIQGKYGKKMQALWIGAWNLGLIRNKKDEALMAFIKRQTKLDHTRFLRYAEDGIKAIEALKGWMAREANVNWSIDKFMPNHAQKNGYKIARAQWHRLVKAEHSYCEGKQFWDVVKETNPDMNFFNPSERDWIPVMNQLGIFVREIK